MIGWSVTGSGASGSQQGSRGSSRHLSAQSTRASCPYAPATSTPRRSRVCLPTGFTLCTVMFLSSVGVRLLGTLEALGARRCYVCAAPAQLLLERWSDPKAVHHAKIMSQAFFVRAYAQVGRCHALGLPTPSPQIHVWAMHAKRIYRYTLMLSPRHSHSTQIRWSSGSRSARAQCGCTSSPRSVRDATSTSSASRAVRTWSAPCVPTSSAGTAARSVLICAIGCNQRHSLLR